jgi:hypothetical protein
VSMKGKGSHIGQRLEGESSPSSFDGGEADRAVVRNGDGKVR